MVYERVYDGFLMIYIDFLSFRSKGVYLLMLNGQTCGIIELAMLVNLVSQLMETRTVVLYRFLLTVVSNYYLDFKGNDNLHRRLDAVLSRHQRTPTASHCALLIEDELALPFDARCNLTSIYSFFP